MPTDPCAGVVCETGQHCEAGVCVPDTGCMGEDCGDPCADVQCGSGELCVDGRCRPDRSGGGGGGGCTQGPGEPTLAGLALLAGVIRRRIGPRR